MKKRAGVALWVLAFSGLCAVAKPPDYANQPEPPEPKLVKGQAGRELLASVPSRTPDSALDAARRAGLILEYAMSQALADDELEAGYRRGDVTVTFYFQSKGFDFSTLGCGFRPNMSGMAMFIKRGKQWIADNDLAVLLRSSACPRR